MDAFIEKCASTIRKGKEIRSGRTVGLRRKWN
jgi:hypothetical protein